jgi:hypothetical protein
MLNVNAEIDDERATIRLPRFVISIVASACRPCDRRLQVGDPIPVP